MLLFELFICPQFSYFSWTDSLAHDVAWIFFCRFHSCLSGVFIGSLTFLIALVSSVCSASPVPRCFRPSPVYKSCVLHPDHQMLSVCGPISLSGFSPPVKTVFQSAKFSHLLLLIILFFFPQFQPSPPPPPWWRRAPAGATLSWWSCSLFTVWKCLPIFVFRFCAKENVGAHNVTACRCLWTYSH